MIVFTIAMIYHVLFTLLRSTTDTIFRKLILMIIRTEKHLPLFSQSFLPIIHCTTKKILTRVIWSISHSSFMYNSKFFNPPSKLCPMLMKIMIFEFRTEKNIFFIVFSIKFFQNFCKAANLWIFICHTCVTTYAVHSPFTIPVF